MAKVNPPEISAAPTMSAMLVNNIFFMALKSVVLLCINCSISVIESPTKLGASTANTLEETVKSNPNNNKSRYLRK